jgi:hypothetical protein
MVKEVVSGLLNEKYDGALFTTPMRIFLNTATGKAFWKWFASHGALGSFTFSDQENAGDDRILHYKVTLGENPYWFSCKITGNGKIAQIAWW